MQREKLLCDANLNTFFYIENGPKTTEQVACFTIKFRFFLLNVPFRFLIKAPCYTRDYYRTGKKKRQCNAKSFYVMPILIRHFP